MKTLHVLRSKAWGGLEHYTLDFISHLSFSENTLLCPKGSKLAIEANRRGLRVTHSFWDLCRHWDVIHVHQRQDLPLARLRIGFNSRIRFLYSLMMNAPVKNKWHHKKIYGRLDGLLSSSLKVCEDVRKHFPIESSKVIYCPYGRDFKVALPTLEQKQEVREKFGLSPEHRVFGTLCRLDRGKGVVELAESLNHLSKEALDKVQIWIIGDPTLKGLSPKGEPLYESDSLQVVQTLKAIQKKFPQNLKLFPYQSNPETYLMAMNVFVLGSYNETYSLAVLDAMSLGLPVIGTKSGGTTEQVGQNMERGWFVEAKSSQDIARVIQSLSSQEIEQKSKKASEWVRQLHTWEQNHKRCQALFRDARGHK